MARISPLYSKSRVDKAANALRVGGLSEEDEIVVENWRASHGVVLNTFRQTLNRHAAEKDIIVAQRLKRRNTIYDKLLRQPNMELTRMQDIAGCRLIFDDVSSLEEFRETMHGSRFKHVLRNSPDDYNYIKNPKASGYRGIHDVYRYKSYSGSHEDARWDGLQIEIQYRTLSQHAWATAVEIYDIIKNARAKYSDADPEVESFFLLASEVIARTREQSVGYLGTLPAITVVQELQKIRSKIDVLDILGKFPPLETDFDVFGLEARYAVIVSNDTNELLQAIPCGNSANKAIQKYFELEKLHPSANIVLVHAEGAEQTRSAFRNYFRDSHDFVSMTLEGMLKIFEDQLSSLSESSLDKNLS